MKYQDLTDKERKELAHRLDDMMIQARDLLHDLGHLKQDLCAHVYDIDSEDIPVCPNCGKIGEVLTVTIARAR